jgi:ABC-type uncharacterized transport system substrate-binding protein
LNGLRDRILPLAHELLELQPDMIVAMTTPVAAILQGETRAIPIVFTGVSNPITVARHKKYFLNLKRVTRSDVGYAIVLR